MVRTITGWRNSDTHHALKFLIYSLVMTCSFRSASGFVYVQHGLVVLGCIDSCFLALESYIPRVPEEVQKIEHG